MPMLSGPRLALGKPTAADAAADLPHVRFLPAVLGSDRIEVFCEVLGAGAVVIRPVYWMPDDNVQFQDVINDRTMTGPGNFVFEFEAIAGAKHAVRVVSIAATSIALSASYAQSVPR